MRTTAIDIESSFLETPDVEAESDSASLLIGCILCVVITLACGALGGNNRTTSLAALIGGGVCGIIVLHLVYGARFFSHRILALAIIAFLIRVAVGVFHNHLFLDSNYFSTLRGFEYLWDFKWMDYSMNHLSTHWKTFGFHSFFPPQFLDWNKNPYIIAYISQLYYWTSSECYLNLTVWNSIHTVMTAFVMGAICRLYGKSDKLTYLIMTVTLFEPLGFFSNIFWRDTVGHFFLIVAAYLIAINGTSTARLLIISPIAAFLCYIMRGPYLFLALVASGYEYVIGKGKQAGPRVILLLVILVLGLGIFRLGNDVVEIGMERNSNQIGFRTFLQLPFRFVRGVTGPFPWSQVFKEPPGWEFHPADYLQFVLNFAVLACVLPVVIRKFFSSEAVNTCCLFGLMFYFTGVVSPAIHVGYVSAGLPLILLELEDEPGIRKRFSIALAVTFAGFLLANFLYTSLGLEGSGIIGKGMSE